MDPPPVARIARVAIVGGGFGGLNAAKTLKRAPVQITLVDRQNHHLFQPLLYQVATAALNASDIAQPIRSVLRRQKNAQVMMAEVVEVDAQHNRLVLRDGELLYDYLILATGATHSYFGKNQWASLAPGLKTIDDALDIRRRVLLAYENAERELDSQQQRAWLTFVIVGGGPTGVELAGALAEISQKTLARDFRHIDPTRAQVILVEGETRVLPSYPLDLSAAALKQLAALGVDVRLHARVTEIDEQGVRVGGEQIKSRTVLWAAGVAASPLGRSLGVPLDRAGRVLVEADLTVPDHPNVFAIGDLASITQDGKPVPGIAPAAIQQGIHAARNILRGVGGLPYRPFRYRAKGTLATIGRAAAVANLRRAHLSGWIAWVTWLAVHIFFLIGFRNRIAVFLQWAWSYLTEERGARLITGARSGRPPPS